MGFFASWPDRRSLFIDTADEDKAAVIALDVGESPPASLVVVPSGVLVFEVFDDPDGGEDDPILVEPIDVAADLLATLEDASEAETEPPPRLALVVASGAPVCDGVAFGDDDDVLSCARDVGHGGKHRSVGGMVW